MKILFLTPRESGTNLGGVERHVRLLTEELGKRGHRVRELALEDSKKINKINRLIDKWINRQIGKKFVYKFKAWKYLWDKRKLLEWAEVIHVHDVFWWVMPFLVIAKIAKISEKREPRVFVTFHGWEGRCPPAKSAVWQKRLAARLCDGTIGVGSFFEKWYGVKTDRVVWGVLNQRRKRGMYKGPTLPRQGRTLREIIFFGRLEEVNGVEIVIKAMKLIRGHKVQPWHTPRLDLSKFTFIGDGSWRKQAEKVGKVTGMVADPWKYLAKADVVIASSYLAILEAAALGKRIIAVANNPLKRDYLEGHPLPKYFKICRSADELAREIIKSIEETPRLGGESPLRAKLWALGQTAEKLGDEYEELWKGGKDEQEGKEG